MIIVIDYGLGNLTSVGNALSKLKLPFSITSDAKKIANAPALILPGVGAAGQGMGNLAATGVDKIIVSAAKKGTPMLGICLGMQLMMSFSEEGNVDCLGLLKGNVKKFRTGLKVPEIGWNQVEKKDQGTLLDGIKNNSYFYFVNSYYCVPEEETVVTGTTDYDGSFCSIFQKENLYGVQFHPEKSGEVGLQLLKNFSEAI